MHVHEALLRVMLRQIATRWDEKLRVTEHLVKMVQYGGMFITGKKVVGSDAADTLFNRLGKYECHLKCTYMCIIPKLPHASFGSVRLNTLFTGGDDRPSEDPSKNLQYHLELCTLIAQTQASRQ